MKKKTIYEKLCTYKEQKVYPFHMPGHKRNKMCINDFFKGSGVDNFSPYDYDITEIDGFDNLHHPEELIKERLEEVSLWYGSKKSYYLVNGSTCGILAAISAACFDGKKLLMARNSHKAAYNAVLLNKIDVDYIYPEIISDWNIQGGIKPSEIESMLSKNNEYGAVYITSPTYEGVVSDIRNIADICHKYDVMLIVDEAHGAHFGFCDKFPKSALQCGADIVIQSLHKTMMSLTQTAILHIGKESRAELQKVEKFLAIYQSSSPSYVLMASIDEAIDYAFSNKEKYVYYAEKIERFKEKMKELKNISLLGKDIVGYNSVYDFDISKLVIYSKNNGKILMDKLRNEFSLEMEMSERDYVIAMTSVFDTDDGFNRLEESLFSIDKEIVEDINIKNISKPLRSKGSRLSIFKSFLREGENVKIDEAENRISGDMIMLYPPGCPLIVVGETISREMIEYIKECKNNGLNVLGVDDNENITVLK